MITGKILRDSIISAANNISNNKEIINELNVFPVPDGDTGSNMSMTISASKKVMMSMSDSASVSEVVSTNASSLLRGARGNSGVILSLIFRGFSKYLTDKTNMTAHDYAFALKEGVNAAYKAVMKPTEGTILTVSRCAADAAIKAAEEGLEYLDVVKASIEEAKTTLEKTPEMLPVLKKAGVVDAGGQGFIYILEGMYSVFSDGVIIESNDNEIVASKSVSSKGEFNYEIDPNIVNGYCTEFIINKNNDVTKEDISKLSAFLETHGDSVVMVDDDDIIKIHLHTDDPGKSLSYAKGLGFLTNMKIENMLEQHRQMMETGKQTFHPKNDNVIYKSDNHSKINQNFKYVKPTGEYQFGFVVVASGQGVINLFKELGANAVISGGQTMNPSTDDILSAINSVDAKNVFVLPNNKNIILAAEQAAELADRNVVVLQTTTIPQGISALLNFAVDDSFKENESNMMRAISNVSTGLITFAARDSDFDGHKIKKGQILALNNGKLSFVENDIDKAFTKLVKQLVKKDSEFITIISGEDVNRKEAEKLVYEIENKFSSLEVSYLDGGQSVYYYIISVE